LGHQLAAAAWLVSFDVVATYIEMASIDATPKVTNVTRKLITINGQQTTPNDHKAHHEINQQTENGEVLNNLILVI